MFGLWCVIDAERASPRVLLLHLDNLTRIKSEVSLWPVPVARLLVFITVDTTDLLVLITVETSDLLVLITVETSDLFVLITV